MALGLVTISAALALTVASRITRNPGLSAIHRQTAVTALVFIAAHGLTLLGDPWLHPAPAEIAVPFLLPYRPLWTGLGIIAGYLAAIFGLSFYIRRRIGPRLWRSVHRLMIVAYVLAVAHTLGAGTDGSTVWLRAWIALTASILLVLSVLRVRLFLRGGPSARHRAPLGDGVRTGAPPVA
jgi:sulfoxide reductase heme-binding subunit YedZ